MDNQRTILIIALAVLSWFLVMKWNEDYGQPIENDSVTISSAQQQRQTDSQAEFSVPQPVGQASSAMQDTGLSNQNNDGLVYIETDVIKMAVDPVGGDIVELSLLKYPRFAKNPDVALKLFENSQERVYVAQTALWGKNGLDRSGERPVFSTSQKEYVLADGQEQVVVDFTHSRDGINYIKRFTLHRGFDTSCSERQLAQLQKSCMKQQGYQIEISYLIDNQSENNWQGSLLAQIKRDGQGDPSSTTATGTATYLGAAVWTPDEPYKKIKMGTMDDKEFVQTIQNGWVAWLQHYFVAAFVPEQNTTNTIFTKQKKATDKYYIIGYNGEEINLAPGAKAELKTTLYAGPKIQSHLKQLSPGLELTVDYGFLWFIAQPIFMLLNIIHGMLGNWGWSIIVLTVIIKAIFYPLSAASYKSMARMRAVAPKIQALKEQAGDDRQKLSQGMMELYKKEKINPLGGCLPILVQMPVFLSLYWVLLESVEMRQVPWILWLTDLSSKDPYFILPIIMGVSMFIQQRLNPAPPDPMQAKIMRMLPIIFTFFFLWFPAGLVLYWVVNNILSIAQQWYVTRTIERQMAARD